MKRNRNKQGVLKRICSLFMIAALVMSLSGVTVFAEEEKEKVETVSESDFSEGSDSFPDDETSVEEEESDESQNNDTMSDEIVITEEDTTEKETEEVVDADSEEVDKKLKEEDSAFDETGIFGCTVTDQNGVKIEGWKDTTNGCYYLFLTNAVSIPSMEVSITGVKMEKTSKGTLDTKKNTITDAFSGSDDSITVTDKNGEKYNIIVKQSGLPSLSVTMNGTTLAAVKAGSKDTKYYGNSVILTDSSGNINVKQDDNVELKGRGNSTWVFLNKKPYQIKFEKKLSVLGMEKAKKWVLLANAFDDSMCRNSTAFNFARQIGMPYTPDYQYCDLWVDGTYEGTYMIGEKIEVGTGRVELKNPYGVIMEYDNGFYTQEEYWCYSSGLGSHFALKEIVDENNSAQGMEMFKNKVDAFCDYLKKTDKSKYTIESLSKYIDVESFAKWYLVDEYMGNNESFVSSWYWYTDGPEDVLHLGPVWDFDTSSGMTRGNESTIDDFYGKIHHWMFSKLTDSPAFGGYLSEVYANYGDVIRNLPGYAVSTCNSIMPSADMNYIRWKYLGTSNVKNNKQADTYPEAISFLADWLSRRYSSFAASLAQKPSAEISGSLSTSGKTWTIKASSVLGTTSLSVAVWSSSGGQDDLKWYPLVKSSDGTYKAAVNLTNHGKSDTYYAHVYGNGAFLGALKEKVLFASGPNLKAEFTEDTGMINIQMDQADDYTGISVAVWSADKGQDDLVWYPVKAKNGMISLTVNPVDHKKSKGTYNIHVYGTPANGKNSFIKQASVTVTAVKSPELTAEFKPNSNTLAVNLKYASDFTDARVAVWGTYNGQKDLKWYTLKKSNGVFSCNVNLEAHGETGTYNLHVYGTKSNKDQFILSREIQVDAFQKPKLQTSVVKEGQLVKAVLENAADYSSVSFAVWGNANGQNDLEWCKAQKDDNGRWIATINLNSHNEEGLYHVHSYTGNSKFLAKADFTVTSLVKPVLECRLTDSNKLLKMNLDPNGLTITKLSFAVWGSSNGQDDLKWYSATRNMDGTWSAAADLFKHKDIGIYNIHAYATIDGKSVNIINETISVSAFLKPVLEIKSGSKIFTAILRNGEDYTNIQFAVWTSDKGQDDLKWYNGYRVSDGSCRYIVNTRNHGGNGIYNVHVYGTKDGKKVFLGNDVYTESSYPDSTLTAVSTDGTGKLVLTLDDQYGYNSVTVAVWGSSNGQNDLKWYTLSPKGDGTFSGTVDTATHKEKGTFNFHAYGTFGKNQYFAAKTTAEI